MLDHTLESLASAGFPGPDKTLVKGFAILEALCTSDMPLGVTTISEQLGIGKSNVHRLLTTLINTGYVQQHPSTREYFATSKLWEQGAAVADRNSVKRIAKPLLLNLLDDLQFGAVFLVILNGTEILYLERLESADSPSGFSRPALRVPAVFPASGKVLLANQPDWEELLDLSMRLSPQAATLNKATLVREFARIREQGFAITINGWAQRSMSIAVAVPRRKHAPNIAIGVGVVPGPGAEARLRSFLPSLHKTAATIGAICD